MTREVHSIRWGHKEPHTRYECNGCGISHSTECGAQECEIRHQEVLKASGAYNSEAIKSPVSYNSEVNKPVFITDHADAAAIFLRKIVKQLEEGRQPEDLGQQVVLIGRMMSRRT